MGNTGSIPADEMLRLLEPTLVRGMERHLSAATEWFPHEYVPYEEGRNYVDEPWEENDSRSRIVAQTALEVNLLTEDNLPLLPPGALGHVRRRRAVGEWTRRWTAEEGRHAIVLRDYLTVTRGVDPVALERGRMDHVSRGYYPAGDCIDAIRWTASSTRHCRSWRRGSRTATRARSPRTRSPRSSWRASRSTRTSTTSSIASSRRRRSRSTPRR